MRWYVYSLVFRKMTLEYKLIHFLFTLEHKLTHFLFTLEYKLIHFLFSYLFIRWFNKKVDVNLPY